MLFNRVKMRYRVNMDLASSKMKVWYNTFFLLVIKAHIYDITLYYHSENPEKPQLVIDLVFKNGVLRKHTTMESHDQNACPNCAKKSD